MGPRNAYNDILDNVVSLIAGVVMNHQNQLEQMANGENRLSSRLVIHWFRTWAILHKLASHEILVLVASQ
jgi:hypothetical protein